MATDVLDPDGLTGIHKGYFAWAADDDAPYLVTDAGAIPVSGTRVLTTLETLTRMGSDYFVYSHGLRITKPSTPVIVGNNSFDGQISGFIDGVSKNVFIAGGAGAVTVPVTPLLPASAETAIFGDSRTNQCYGSDQPGDNPGTMEGYGYAYWAQTLSDARARLAPEYDYGVGGDTTADMLARIGDVTATEADTVIILGGANDRGSAALTYAQSVSNMSAMISALRAAGKIIILIAELPRTSLSDPQLTYHVDFHEWLLGQHSPANGIYVVNPWDDIVDPGSATYQPLAGMLHDGLHPGPTGAYYTGKAVATILDSLLPPVDYLTDSNSNQYDASTNPGGDLVVNPLMTGTGGSKSGGTLGTVADSWTLTALNATGLTITGSKVTVDGRTMQQIAVTGTPSSANAYALLQQILDTSDFLLGDTVEAFAYMECDAGAAGLAGLQTGLRMEDANGTYYPASGDQYTGSTFFPDEAWSGVVRIARFTIGGTVTYARFRSLIQTNQNDAISATIRIGNITLKKYIGTAETVASLSAAMFDPGDKLSLYTDSSGVYPVALDQDTIGMMLDHSRMRGFDAAKFISYQPELLTNGTFASDITGWSAGMQPAGQTAIWDAGTIKITASADYASRQQSFTTVVGEWYRVSGDLTAASTYGTVIKSDSSGDVNVNRADAGYGTASGTLTFYFKATATTSYIHLMTDTSGNYANWDNISVKAVPGNHAQQSSATLRPLWQEATGTAKDDLSDDVLTATFAGSLGSTCTVVYWDGSAVQTLTDQTIGTTYDVLQSQYVGRMAIIADSLTSGELATIQKWAAE